MRDLSKGKRVDNGKEVIGFYFNVPEHHNPDLSGKSIIISINNGLYFEVVPETVERYIGLVDENGKNIFTGDKFVPFYITPTNERTNELDYDNAGVVKSGVAEFVLERKVLPDISMKSFVDMEFSHYLPNYGEVYKYKDNIAHGIIIGNIHDNPEFFKEDEQ